MPQKNTSTDIRENVITVLLKFDNSSQALRQIIRQYLTANTFPYPVAAKIQSLALGVIQYRNTIDFILHRCRYNLSLKELNKETMYRLRLALLESRWQNVPIQALEHFLRKNIFLKILKKATQFDLISAVSKMNSVERNSVLYSHPTFFVKTLTEKMGEKNTISLMKSNNSPPISYLRVNQIISNPNLILNSLREEGVVLEQDKDIPFLYIVKEGMNTIVTSPAFSTGKIFIQDKASVLAVTTLNPQSEDIIWDACAAPGMKTHLLWELVKGKGKVIASDVHLERLKSAQQRLSSYGSSEIEWIHADASEAPVSTANKILIDAPCSSTGIIQSHPSYKWRLNKKTLFAIMTIQNKILHGILSKYENKPGTEILYSTCSVLPHEGENQIDSILDSFNVELLPGPNLGQNGYSNFKCSKNVRRLFPHSDKTNGFFIAHMKIKG